MPKLIARMSLVTRILIATALLLLGFACAAYVTVSSATQGALLDRFRAESQQATATLASAVQTQGAAHLQQGRLYFGVHAAATDSGVVDAIAHTFASSVASIFQ